MATRMSSISGPSGYMLELLGEGVDFTLYRGRQQGNPSSVLAIALAAEQPSLQSLRRLEHEYSLAAELDSTWAAKPLALARHEGGTILLLNDPGGEPLDGILERDHGQPLDLTRFLRIAIGLAVSLGQVHRHGLIHKDIKPANVLVDGAIFKKLMFGESSKPNLKSICNLSTKAPSTTTRTVADANFCSTLACLRMPLAASFSSVYQSAGTERVSRLEYLIPRAFSD